MEIVYYYDKDLGYCPVKKYLEKYLISKNDNESNVNRKEKILVGIRQKLLFIQQNGGNPDGSIAKPIHGYNFFQIRAGKDSKRVIRILYLCLKKSNLIVLLNAFDKPDNYDTDRERKKIEKEYKKTNDYLYKFKNNPKNYEKYK